MVRIIGAEEMQACLDVCVLEACTPSQELGTHLPPLKTPNPNRADLGSAGRGSWFCKGRRDIVTETADLGQHDKSS